MYSARVWRSEAFREWREVDTDKCNRIGDIIREESIHLSDVGDCARGLQRFRVAAGFGGGAIHMFRLRHCFDRQRRVYLSEQRVEFEPGTMRHGKRKRLHSHDREF